MGEVNVPQQKDAGRPARKILSTRVDLTPMVDLGFLLITFFIFTTKIGEPKVMDLQLPADSIDSSKVENDKTLNLVLGGNDVVWYYYGDEIDKISSTNFSGGLRKIILDKRDMVRQQFGNPKETVVLIKPTTYSSYKNVVDVFDETNITGITRRVLMEPSQDEVQRVKP